MYVDREKFIEEMLEVRFDVFHIPTHMNGTARGFTLYEKYLAQVARSDEMNCKVIRFFLFKEDDLVFTEKELFAYKIQRPKIYYWLTVLNNPLAKQVVDAVNIRESLCAECTRIF
jgi:hypothetical protein